MPVTYTAHEKFLMRKHQTEGMATVFDFGILLIQRLTCGHQIWLLIPLRICGYILGYNLLDRWIPHTIFGKYKANMHVNSFTPYCTSWIGLVWWHIFCTPVKKIAEKNCVLPFNSTMWLILIGLFFLIEYWNFALYLPTSHCRRLMWLALT